MDIEDNMEFTFEVLNSDRPFVAFFVYTEGQLNQSNGYICLKFGKDNKLDISKVGYFKALRYPSNS